MPRIALSCLCWAGAGPALAADTQFGEEALVTLLEERAPFAAAFEINTSVFPSVNDAFNASNAPRNGATVSFNATQHMDVTRWLNPQAQNRLGFALGLSEPAHSLATPSATAAGAGSSSPQLDLGLRWRSDLRRGRHLDVSAWAQSPDAATQIWQTQQQPTYSTRVEVQWASSRTRGLVPEFGAIGVRLQSGSRLVLRARKGGPMLYYRAKF